jgi:mannose-6-phosphate isomerase-like protein (cupin superfamily)
MRNFRIVQSSSFHHPKKRGRMNLRNFLSLVLAVALPSLAQTTEPTIHTSADLQQREAKLLIAAKASPTGLALDTFDDFGSSKGLLVVRIRTGESELHQQWADQMIVTKGTLTLVTGGTMQGDHTTAPGEIRGSGIEGGKEIVLHAGDIVHIPAGIPHQVKLAPDTTVTYIAFKEK